jgi:hypothetical protein
MLKELWQKVQARREENKGESLRQTSAATGVPKSTVHHHEQRRKKRIESSGTDQWETAWGQWYLKRMIISTIYTFGIKGGVGAGRISEHFGHLQLEGIGAVSESSIQRLTKEIEANILWYKELEEAGLQSEARQELKELKVVLGLDETWLDEMLLVCQELTSGYIFLRKQARNGTPAAGGGT